MLPNTRQYTTNSGGYKMSNYDEDYEDEYGIPWVAILDDEDRGLLEKVKGILNTELTGEEYIHFNRLREKLDDELVENSKEQQVFEDTKSSGLMIDRHWSAFEPKEPTELWRAWAKGGYHEKEMFTEEIETDNGTKTIKIKNMTYEIAKEKVRTYLIDKHKANNDNPLYDLGHSLTLYKDYWGSYKAFSGNLKPIDVASYMTALCDRVGKFLQTTTAKGRGSYSEINRSNYKYETPKHLLKDDCWLIDDFIEEWNNDDNNEYKFPTKPKEEEVTK